MIKKRFSSVVLMRKPYIRFVKSVIPPWTITALGELGQEEIAGEEDNPRIVEYLNSVDLTKPLHHIDEVPWCSALVNFCITKCGIVGTNNALARSWLKWGEKLSEPVFGCITVIERGNNTWSGHVGFLMDITPNYIHMLGGNQSNRVSMAVYPKSKVLGYLWPI